MTDGEGNTPLTPEELDDLIPALTTKQDLNEWEEKNIILARTWADTDRTTAIEVVTEGYVRKLHSKMFDETWK